MRHQPRDDPYGESPLFRNGITLQAPPDGTVARDAPALRAALENRPPMTPALLARGQDRYAIYCTPCHDAAGTGHGTVPARGFPTPPSLLEDRLRAASSRHLVDVIGNGVGVMYPFRRIPPQDRWAIAAYIRALQLSQDAEVARLPEAERRQLAAAPDAR
jgi:mono/diheme cytochrome c family protein